MASNESVLRIINRLFAEAARLEGDSPLAIVERVEALVAALAPGDRLAVRAALERMAALSAATAAPAAAETRH